MSSDGPEANAAHEIAGELIPYPDPEPDDDVACHEIIDSQERIARIAKSIMLKANAAHYLPLLREIKEALIRAKDYMMANAVRDEIFRLEKGSANAKD